MEKVTKTGYGEYGKEARGTGKKKKGTKQTTGNEATDRVRNVHVRFWSSFSKKKL